MAERIGVILEPRARGFDKVDGQRNVLHLEHRHRHLHVFTHGMDVLALNELVVEVIELIVEQLHDRGGCIFDVERDLRVADLHDVSLLAAHLERLQMAGISEISLGTLALEDVQGSETLTYDILIPDGVNNLSGITSATLTISSGDISTKEVEATHFSYENFSGDHTVTVVTSSLPVTLRGSASDLEAIYGREVHVIADLSDIAADSGSYTVPARIEVSGYDVGAVGTYEVTVHIS